MDVGAPEGMGDLQRHRSIFAFRSLRAKFLLVVVPLVLLSTLIVFGLFELNAQREGQERLQNKLEKMVAIQCAVVAESLWNVADSQIKLILEALATDPDVSGAAVYDDIDILVGDRNLPAEPSDPRDPDGDGVVTVIDTRFCVTQCKNYSCAPDPDPPGGTSGETSETGETGGTWSARNACGLGFELALLLAPVMALRARRRAGKVGGC